MLKKKPDFEHSATVQKPNPSGNFALIMGRTMLPIRIDGLPPIQCHIIFSSLSFIEGNNETGGKDVTYFNAELVTNYQPDAFQKEEVKDKQVFDHLCQRREYDQIQGEITNSSDQTMTLRYAILSKGNVTEKNPFRILNEEKTKKLKDQVIEPVDA